MNTYQKTIFTLLLTLPLFFTGCELAEGIFNVGFWVGVIVVVAIVLLILWLFNKMKK